MRLVSHHVMKCLISNWNQFHTHMYYDTFVFISLVFLEYSQKLWSLLIIFPFPLPLYMYMYVLIKTKMKWTSNKTKTQISFAVTAKIISAFVFATRIVQFLYFLNPKVQVSSLLLGAVQAGSCRTWSKTQIVGFVTHRLK